MKVQTTTSTSDEWKTFGCDNVRRRVHCKRKAYGLSLEFVLSGTRTRQQRLVLEARGLHNVAHLLVMRLHILRTIWKRKRLYDILNVKLSVTHLAERCANKPRGARRAARAVRAAASASPCRRAECAASMAPAPEAPAAARRSNQSAGSEPHCVGVCTRTVLESSGQTTNWSSEYSDRRHTFEPRDADVLRSSAAFWSRRSRTDARPPPSGRVCPERELSAS